MDNDDACINTIPIVLCPSAVSASQEKMQTVDNCFLHSIQPTVSADVMSSIDCPPSLYFKMIQIEY